MAEWPVPSIATFMTDYKLVNQAHSLMLVRFPHAAEGSPVNVNG